MSNDKRRRDDDVAGVSDCNDRRVENVDRVLIRADEAIVIENDDRKRHNRFDDDDVAGIRDENNVRVINADKVIIRADEVRVIRNDDDRDDRKHHRRGFSWI
ncbi:MAG TPA: hypothetical protein VNM45_07135 [Bacillus sp. (in: firmicutes)]|nr:hypothetical protein [Bacillus sp. (in: firmicutes)]